MGWPGDRGRDPRTPPPPAGSHRAERAIRSARQRGFLAATISARTGGLVGPLYVHAKIGIVDDAWLTVGSANLNAHSLFNDTEMNVVSCDPALARDTRLRLWAEHLERSIEEVSGDPAQVIDELWRPISANGGCRAHNHRRPHNRGRGCTDRRRLEDLPVDQEDVQRGDHRR
jgi:phosphatidylserine/phosphatidylglycerophosphate/cardiolipin synthase-like enzyme